MSSRTIYMLTKPSDPNTIYIGQTTSKLKYRKSKHKHTAKKYPTRLVYTWYDDTVEITFIESFYGDKKSATVREMEIVQEYLQLGYNVMNTHQGQYILDPAGCRARHNAKNNPKTNVGTYKKPHNTKHNALKHPDYNKWCNKMWRASNKEGLTSREYRLKHSIPEYTGLKTII